jgi:hypothetical protein
MKRRAPCVLKSCYVPTSGDCLPVAAVAAARFLAGEVGSQDINVDTLMWCVLQALAKGGAGIADETCASAALSDAAVEVPRAKFDKDGFAPGIKRKPRRIWPPMMAGDLAAYMKFAKEISRKRLPSVGVLKEG